MGLANQAAIMNRGDPGLFGAIGGALGGFLSGGPLGAIGGAIQGFRGPQVPPPPPALRQQQIGQVGVPGVSGILQRAIPGGQTGFQIAQIPQGMHLNKSGYYTRAGYVAAKSKYVRNRRKNYANGRALRKAISRVQGFEREVKRSRRALRSLSRI